MIAAKITISHSKYKKTADKFTDKSLTEFVALKILCFNKPDIFLDISHRCPEYFVF